MARRLGPLLKQALWQEDPNHWQYGRETLHFTVFWGKLFSKGAQADASKYVENTVFTRSLEPRVQHRWKTVCAKVETMAPAFWPL